MPPQAQPGEVSAELYELLARSRRPLKAKELAQILTRELNFRFDRHDINVILYRLKKHVIVTRDEQFRWSVCATVTRNEIMALFAASIDPKLKKQLRELGPRPISAPIGHWVFMLGREPKSGREVWRIECALCGFQTGCRVQNHQEVFPLTGKLSIKRRRHDKAVHPENAKEQIRIEKSLLREIVKTRPE